MSSRSNAGKVEVGQGGGTSPIGRESATFAAFDFNISRVNCAEAPAHSTPPIALPCISPLFDLLFQSLAMAGGAGKYRHLSRKSSHRQALLRNLVTSLFENESITTTWAKAKEAQRLADKLITLGKKNSEASRRRALEIFYVRDLTVSGP